MNYSSSHLVQLWLAIVVMSTSGVLARALHVSPEVAIWVRCLIASFALLIVLRLLKLPLWVKGKAFWTIGFSTVLFGIHWVTYFYALHYSTVAIGMLSLFTYPVFTAILEPMIVGSRLKLTDVLLSLLAFAGVYFLVPDFDLANEVTLGVLIGLVSAVAYSFRNILLKLNAKEHSGITLMFMQLVGLSVLLCPVLFMTDPELTLYSIADDWVLLLVLGLFTTAIGHTLFVLSFKYFSITTVSILSTLTPLMGIGLGYFLLDEIPEGNIWIGAGLISFATIVESVKTTIRPKGN